jgi:hypothetical protein
LGRYQDKDAGAADAQPGEEDTALVRPQEAEESDENVHRGFAGARRALSRSKTPDGSADGEYVIILVRF